jgi:hypothetical protein
MTVVLPAEANLACVICNPAHHRDDRNIPESHQVYQVKCADMVRQPLQVVLPEPSFPEPAHRI